MSGTNSPLGMTTAPGTAPANRAPRTRRRRLGFSWPVLVALAALAAPRVVLHDLDIIQEGSVVNALFVFVPPACWVAAVLWRRPRRPCATVVVIGAIYGVFLAVGHLLLWDVNVDGTGSPMGGQLADVDTGTQEAFLRISVVLSSLVTGTLVGVVTGALASLLSRVVPAGPAARHSDSAHVANGGDPRHGHH